MRAIRLRNRRTTRRHVLRRDGALLAAITVVASLVVGIAPGLSTPAFAASAPVITSTSTTNFGVGAAGATFTPAASNTPTSWSETGTLPTGVSFSTSTGAISGTPAAGTSGVYIINLTATNAGGSGTQTFFLDVWSGPVVCGSWLSIVAPASGVTALSTSIAGGGGGGGGYGGNSGSGDGGGAATATATYTVSAGQKLWANIGCGGGGGDRNNATAGGAGTAGNGGILGGAGGTDVGSANNGAGGGGGGASVFCTGNGNNCSGGTNLVIAAGGGGGGGNACSGTAGAGGDAAAGGAISGAGFQGQSGAAGGTSPNFGAGGGGAGTTTAGGGGAHGTNANSSAGDGVAGSGTPTGTGGRGGQEATSASHDHGGGGGGGGWAGGGGGGASGCNSGAAGAGGGGAGSSWVNTTSASGISFSAQTTNVSTCGQTTANGTTLGAGNGGLSASTNAIASAGCAGNVSLNWVASPSKLAFAQGPSNVAAGASMSAVTVQVQDQFGNAVNASGLTVTLTASSGTINAGASATTNAAGLATFSGIQINTAATGLTLTAASSGLTSTPASSAFNVTAAAANKLVFSQGPSNVAAGVSMSPAVTVAVEDQFGNVVLTDSGRTVTIAPSAGSIASGNSTTTAAGVATFNAIKINTVATGLTLTASATGLTSTPASAAFNVTAGTANKLAFVQGPSNAAAGAAMTPAVTVQLQDQFGNSAAGAGVSITLTPSAGTINAGATTTTAASGLATFSGIIINTAATGLTLTASSSGLTSSAASSAFNVTAGSTASLAFGTQPSNVTAGVSMSPAVTVIAKDAFNNVVSGATVTVSPSAGTINAGSSAVTNSSGVATFNGIQINTAATGLTLTATSGATTSAASTAFNVTAGAANKLVFVQQPSSVTAGVAMTPAVSVQVTDSFGNPVASNGVSITLTGSTSPIVAGNTAATNAGGLATFGGITINASTAAETITATSATPSLTSPASSSFAVSAAAANKLGFVQQPTNVAAGVSISPAVTVQLQDPFGNNASGAGVTVTLAPSAGTISAGGTATTAANGLATFSGIQFTTTATGLTLTATATGLTAAGPSTSFNVTAGTANKLIFLQGPSNVVAGATMTPAVTVQVQDQFGNLTNDTGRTITLVPSSGSITSGNTANTASGVATFGAIKINTAANNLTLTATASGLTTAGPSTSFAVSPAAANKLALVQGPSNVAAGASMTPAVTVQVEDQFSNNVPGAGVSVALTATGTTIDAGNTATTVASGLATFSGIQIDTAGTGYSLTATSSGLIAAGPSTTFNVTAGIGTKLGFGTQPSNVAAGASMSPVTVQVQDQFGNAASSSGVLVTVTPSAGTIASGNTASSSSGVATFNAIKINTAATGLTLTATASGLTASGASSTFNVTPAAASKLVFVQGPSDVVAGASMAPAVTVQVQDQFGNFVSTDAGRTVTVVPSSGTIASGNTATTAAGVATFNAIKINTAATGLTLTATTSGLTTAPASNTFNVTAAAASKLGFVQEPSNVAAGTAMAPAVTVQIQDTFGNAVASNAVSVTLAVSIGSISSGSTGNTVASGLATFGAITINSAATGLTLTASASGLTTSPASSTFNVTAAAPNKLVYVQQPSDTAVGVAMTPAVTVQLQDQFGNSAPNSGVTVTLTPSTGTISAGNTATTAASGLATFSGITINTATTGLTVNATATGLTATGASTPFTVYVAVSGSTPLTDTAADTGSGVHSVSYYYCTGYSGTCTSATGTLIGTSTTAAGGFPFTWSSLPASGAYRLVSVGIDNVTNTSSASASIPVHVSVTQTITFTTTPPTAGRVGGTYTVQATASSGLTVAITLDATSTGCTISGAVVTFTAAGTCVIDANQAGNAQFTAAPQKQQTIPVLAALAITSITSTNVGSITPGTSSETITFNNPLNPTTVPATGTLSMSITCSLFGFSCSNTTLNVSGLTNSALDVGNTNWVTKPNGSFGNSTNTNTYAVTMTLSNGNKTITLSVGACGSCGSVTSGATGVYHFILATTITDLAGQTAPEFDTASSFKIF